MKKKRIAQLCCAALVAAGVGLNIQNALSDYGMNKNSLSLVAVGGQEYHGECPYYTGETLGWCSFVNQTCIYTSTNDPEPEIVLPSHSSSTNSNSYSNTTLVTRYGRIEECSIRAGYWKLFFEAFPDGHEEYITGIKQTYFRWSYTKRSGYKPNPDGTTTFKYYWLKTCKEYYGAEDSECYRDQVETEWID